MGGRFKHTRAVGYKDTGGSSKALIKTLKMNDPSGHVCGYCTLTFVGNSQKEIFLFINETLQPQNMTHLGKIWLWALSDRLYFKGWVSSPGPLSSSPVPCLGFTKEWVCPPAAIHLKHVWDGGGLGGTFPLTNHPASWQTRCIYEWVQMTEPKLLKWIWWSASLYNYYCKWRLQQFVDM